MLKTATSAASFVKLVSAADLIRYLFVFDDILHFVDPSMARMFLQVSIAPTRGGDRQRPVRCTVVLTGCILDQSRFGSCLGRPTAPRSG